ncbi:MAG TPA: conjugal transfer protein TraF, partial [Gammaproteobacteria bacterium]
MPTLERLGWAVALLVLMGVAAQLLRVMQRRKAAAAGPLRVGDGEAALIVVVSAHCAICPAQKGVVAQLRQRYPALQVVTLDAEQQLAQVRALSVMTVPTTLLQGADG